jgi:phosphatidylglycerol lysyltransferase
MRDDARALSLVERFGRTGTAFQVLSPGLSHWFDNDRGVVAYVDTGRSWVAAGEPVAASAEAIGVAERFVTAAHAVHRRASFFATEGNLASSPRFQRVQLGEQPVWDPQQWPAHVTAHRSLREQLRRARAKGIGIRAIDAETLRREPQLVTRLDALVRHWLAARPMPPMRFLAEVAPLDHLAHRRMFVAERANTVVGVLSLAPVPARNGWLFEHLLRDPQAPNGTAELLVDSAMRSLAGDGVQWATLGLAPLSGEVPSWMARVRSLSRPLFNFAGLAAFKRKLRPQHWEPMYLAYPVGSSSVAALLDGLRAFAGGSLWRFGLRMVLRGPMPLLRALEWLLVPWTMLLAAVPTTSWFPSRAVQWSWVLFDAALVLLLRLVRRRAWLAGAVLAASAITVDGGLTIWQAMVWNIPHATHWSDIAVLVVALMGPLVTAPMLWGAVVRLRQLRAAPQVL